jgi:opacity protein-like surface antigen
MRRFILSATLLGLAAVTANAQNIEPARSGSFFISPYAGYMVFGDLFESANGNVEMSNEDGALFGAQAGVNITPSIALLGNLGYTKSAFTLEFDDQGVDQRTSDDLGIFFYDASLQFRIPTSSSRISPLAQIGAGAVKYTFDTDDIQSEGRTDVAFNLGLGADIGLARGVAIRLMAKDYITSFKWEDLDSVDFDDDIEGNVAHNFGLSAGLRIGN